ncbi:MAG: hypothetical protein QGF00_01650 [Planctomycetota bacterium]|nr:hypothetical protein [Planctomycetota bacterium]
MNRPCTHALILLSGLLLSMPENVYRAEQKIGTYYNLLDGSWRLEMAERFGRGELAGRDFTFTHGPVFQLSKGLGFVLGNGDLASLMRFESVLDVCMSVIALWGMLCFTRAPLAWRAAVFLTWCAFMEITFKPTAGMLVLAACGHLWRRFLICERDQGSPESGSLTRMANNKFTPQRSDLCLLAALPAPTLLLYSFEFGVFTLVSVIFLMLTVVACTFKLDKDGAADIRREALFGLGAAVLGAVVFVILFSIAPGWNNYLPGVIELAAGYAAEPSSGFSDDGPGFSMWLAPVVAACIIFFVAVWALRRSWEKENASSLFTLIGLCCFALVWSRYSLTRGDWSHVLHGTTPILFLCGCFLPCWLRQREHKYAKAALIGGLLLVGNKFVVAPVHTGSQIVGRLFAFTRTEFQPARLSVENLRIREAAAAAMMLEGDTLYIWPHETIVNVIAGKKNPAPTLQSYSAHTVSQQDEVIEKMQGVPVLLFTSTWPMHHVEHMTRTSRIFRYIVENYELTEPPRDGFALLKPARRKWKEEPLNHQPSTINHSSSYQPLTINHPPCRFSDLIVLRLRASKTSSFGVFKPGKTIARLHLSNNKMIERKLLLPQDGQTHEILVSASRLEDDPLLLSIFGRRHWRSTETVRQIEILWQPLDFLSLRPASITLEQLSVLRMEGAEEREASLREQESPELQDWMEGGVGVMSNE